MSEMIIGEQGELIEDDPSGSPLHSIDIERDDLNENLGGGIPKGAIILIEGPPGAGKSILAQRFAYGLIENDQSLTYVSTELTTIDFIDQMMSLGYDVTSSLLSLDLLFVSVYPLIGTMRPQEEYLKRLMEAEELFNREIIVIDALSNLVARSMDTANMSTLISFLKKLAGMKKTIIITVEDGELDPISAKALCATADVYLQMNLNASEDMISRVIQVKRFMKAVERVNEIIAFRVEAGLGLVIELAGLA
jgi:archaeal flagellar protein FlaH